MTLSQGSVVANLKLVKLLSRDAMTSTWTAEASDGRKLAVHIADGEDVTPEVEQAFWTGARALARFTQTGGDEGVLRVYAVDEIECAFESDLWTVGSVADLTALDWPLPRRLDLFTRVCSSLAALHEAGILHGCMRPSNILLDDDLLPILSDVGMIPIALGLGSDLTDAHSYRVYAAPEVNRGSSVDARADVFAAGRLLHFLLLKAEPPEEPEGEVPRLTSIATLSPAGLVRVVRRCSMTNPDDRYPGMRELMADLANYRSFEMVGIGHPEVREVNMTDTSLAPVPAAQAPVTAASATRVRKPVEPIAPMPRILDLSPGTRQALSAMGLLLIVGCLIYAGVAGRAPFGIQALVALFAALPTLVIPVPPDRSVVRVAYGLGAIVLFALINPADIVASKGGSRGTWSNDPAANADMARKLVAFRATDFREALFRGADLSKIDFSHATLDHADLRSANLSGANLVGASLVNTHLGEANLSGANLTDATLHNASGLVAAHCDARTIFPRGTTCVNGRPALH